ncbi:MAG: helix-turn-helix transcriptional regulator [Pseudoxanthomonas sp.]
MNLPAPPAPALMTELAALAACPRADGYACITARHEHGAKAVDVEQPALAIVLQGRKRVQGTAQRMEFAAGQVFAMLRRCRLDVVNLPDPHGGLYLTLTIPLCEQVLDAARLLWDAPVTAADDEFARLELAALERPLRQWLHALRGGDYPQARAALAMLVVDLCRAGFTGLLLPPPPSVAARVRAQVAADPAHGWQSGDFERALGLSGATLRRRLAAEGTTLREVVAGARLACAMELLYTTRWPIKTVAARVGYRSAASFVRRFGERYGMDPGQIGNAQPGH